jgi:hypothetical protein
MIHVLVNGVQVELPAQASSSLRDLLTEIRAGYSTETSLISSILVNGIEIDAQDETAIGGVRLSELRSLEASLSIQLISSLSAKIQQNFF